MEETSFSAAELAARAQVDPELIGRLDELGILGPAEGEAPYGLGDMRRVRLADACRQAGLSLEGSARRSPPGGCRSPSWTWCRWPGGR
jgi:hypothetical protein